MSYPSQARYALIGKQTLFGTPVTADKDLGLIITDVDTPQTREIVETSGISSIESVKINSGTKETSVSISGDLQHVRLWEYIFGSVAHVETSGDFVHTFTISNSPPSATIETGKDINTDVTLTSSGQTVDSVTLTAELNANYKMDIDFKGKIGIVGDVASTSITSALQCFPHPQVTVRVNSVAADKVQSASITITKTFEGVAGLGSDTFVDGFANELKFEFTATLGFTDRTFHDFFANNTVTDFEIDADNGVALGSGKQQIFISLDGISLASFNEATSVGGITFLEISGTGLLNVASGTDNISGALFS